MQPRTSTAVAISIVDDNGPQTLAFGLEVIRRVAGALDLAAVYGDAHTDITPYKGLLTANGYVRVLNFGLSRTRNRTGSSTLLPNRLRERRVTFVPMFTS